MDARGIRPLSIGRLGDAYVVASETCAFNIIGATFERDVLPGELLAINDDGIQSIRFAERKQRKLCAMEYVYFSRPDSDLNEVNVHASRKRMRSEEHTSELQSRGHLVCRLLLEKKKYNI